MKHTQVKELAARLLTFDPTHGIQGLDEFSRELTQLINSGQKVNFEIDDARKIANDAWEFREGMTEAGWKLALTKSIDEFGKRKWNEACDAYAKDFFGGLKEMLSDETMIMEPNVFLFIRTLTETQDEKQFPKPLYK